MKFLNRSLLGGMLLIACCMMAVLLTSNYASADEPLTPVASPVDSQQAPADHSFKSVTITNGAPRRLDGQEHSGFKMADLPKEFQSPFTAAILKIDKNAYYARSGDELFIGLSPEKDFKAGERLAIVKFASDCPNNSQFDVDVAPGFVLQKDKTLREILIAWTRDRHSDPGAKVLLVRELYLNRVDVQLDLKPVASR